MTLSEFARGISGFAGMPPADKLRAFAWFLLSEQGRDRFLAADLTRCFEGTSAAKPGNIHDMLTAMCTRKPPELLKDSKGYRLEGRFREQLDQKYGRPRDQIAVAKIIAELIAKVPSAAEKRFLQETVACYSATAFRAAIVMAWALAMDHVLEWALADAARLQRFNARVPVRFPKKAGLTINRREDFETELKEWEIIEILSSSGLISSGIFKVMKQRLDQRNSAAHPSTLVFTQPQAEDAITDLVNNVVLAIT